MLKFKHKKHLHKQIGIPKMTVYYSLSDILLGAVLIILCAFFAYYYMHEHGII